MKIMEINSVEDFKSLRRIWNYLLGKSGDRNIFLTWDWLFTWWKYFGNNKKLNILLVEDQNDIVGIIPLLCSKYPISFGETVVENIGLNLSDYGGIIYSDEDNNQTNKMFDLIKSYLKNNKLMLRFDQIPNDSKFINLLHNHSFCQDSLFIGVKKTGFSPYLPIQSSLDEHLNILAKKFRKNLRIGEKNIEKKIGNIEFKKYSTSNSLEKNLNDFWDLHQKKFKYQNLPYFNKTQKEFLTEVAKTFSQNGWLNLSFLDVNGQHASGILGFEYYGKYYYYQTAFDPKNSYSVGNIHILYLLKDLITRNLKEFDFLRGDEAYKFRWQPLLRSNNRIVIMNKSRISKIKFNTLNWMFLYEEIKKRSLLDNYKLYTYKMNQMKENKKIKFRENI